MAADEQQANGPKRVVVEGLSEGANALSAPAAHYVGRVLRLRVGQTLLAVDPRRGLEAEAVLLQVGRGARVQAAAPRPGSQLGIPGLHLVQCLGKGDKLERVLRDAVALGVTQLSVVVSERTVVRPREQAAEKHARWLDIAIDVARQCGRSNIPFVQGPMTFDERCEHQQGSEQGSDLVLRPGAPALLDVLTKYTRGQGGAAIDERAPLRVWIGPEGGFSPLELGRLRELRALEASLGPLVLRTETAATVALAVVAAVVGVQPG